MAGSACAPVRPLPMFRGRPRPRPPSRKSRGTAGRPRPRAVWCSPCRLAAVEAAHLVRDRVVLAEDEMAALSDSLRARGQQTPIEVMELDAGRYGLISGWRRLTALQQLHAETGDAAFASIKALLRRREDLSAAYVAMVEENEIRADLSFYERARIAVQAAAAGVYPDTHTAVQSSFPPHGHRNAPRSPASPIWSSSSTTPCVFPHPSRKRLAWRWSRRCRGTSASGTDCWKLCARPTARTRRPSVRCWTGCFPVAPHRATPLRQPLLAWC